MEELTDRDLSSEMSFGYDEDFVSPIDEDLQCSICYLALRELVLTRCGHRFCRQCLDQHMARFVPSFCFRKERFLTKVVCHLSVLIDIKLVVNCA